jgi:hypothetical protein
MNRSSIPVKRTRGQVEPGKAETRSQAETSIRAMRRKSSLPAKSQAICSHCGIAFRQSGQPWWEPLGPPSPEPTQEVFRIPLAMDALALIFGLHFQATYDFHLRIRDSTS